MSNKKKMSHALLDRLNRDFGNDADVSRAIKVSQIVISKIRNQRMPLGETVILRIHEAFGIPVSEIRQLSGVPSKVIRPVQTSET